MLLQVILTDLQSNAVIISKKNAYWFTSSYPFCELILKEKLPNASLIETCSLNLTFVVLRILYLLIKLVIPILNIISKVFNKSQIQETGPSSANLVFFYGALF